MKEMIRRIPKDEVTSFIAMGLRMGANIIILPVILRKIPSEEMALWYVFISLAAIAPIFDMGFSSSIARFSAAFWGGAKEVQSQGLDCRLGDGPNLERLSVLYAVARKVYAIAGLSLAVLLAALSPLFIFTSQNAITPQVSLAWWLFVLSAGFSLFALFGNNMLRGMGKIAVSQGIVIGGFIAYIIIVSTLVLSGAGLLSLVAGTLVSNVAIYLLSRKILRQMGVSLTGKGDRQMIKSLFPNSWRTALISLGAYFIYNTNILLCSRNLGPEITASYGLSNQVVGFLSSLGSVFISVKVPALTQAFIARDNARVRKIFLRALTFGALLFVGCSAVLLIAGPVLLEMIGSQTNLLPMGFLSFFLFYRFLEFHHCQYAALVVAENKVPFSWHAIAAGFLILVGGTVFVKSFGLWGLLMTTASVQLIINNWYPVMLGYHILKRKNV